VKLLSDNVTSADNQQERLIKIGWIVGFVDGEGCFSIGFVKQINRSKRKGYKTGIQVAHRFVVTQGISSLTCLEDLQKFFGIGRVSINRRYDNHKEHLAQYVVNNRSDLINVIIPFFEQYKLSTSKRFDFEQFAKCMRKIEQGDHIEIDGLIEIIKLAETMNHKKSREDLIRILRDYTPDA
jgi:hypothetical protein